MEYIHTPFKVLLSFSNNAFLDYITVYKKVFFDFVCLLYNIIAMKIWLKIQSDLEEYTLEDYRILTIDLKWFDIVRIFDITLL